MTRKLRVLCALLVFTGCVLHNAVSATTVQDKQLFRAAEIGDATAFRAALEAGGNMHTKEFRGSGFNEYGYPLLSVVEGKTGQGYDEIVQILRDNGAFLDHKLLKAAKQGTVKVVQNALVAGANIHVRDWGVVIPLYIELQKRGVQKLSSY